MSELNLGVGGHNHLLAVDPCHHNKKHDFAMMPVKTQKFISTRHQAPVPLNIELTKFDRIQILLEIHIAVLSRIVGLS